MAKKIVVEFEAKGLEGVSKTVGDVVEETKSLKQQFREAAKEAQTLAGSSIIDQKALDDAIARTAELKDRMNDVNEQVGVLTAGSKFEKMSNNLGDIGGKIASLDFEGANESASRLLNFSKSITFGDAAKGIKDLGSTFLQLGKALLTNPLFLIAAVIAGVVFAVVKLLDKIGVLKVIMNALGKVFEFVMIPINAIIDGLKELADWLGITNNAAEDAASKQAAAAESLAGAYESKSDRVVAGYDHEIRMAELNGESTREAELKKAYFILNTAKARAQADIAAYKSAKLSGDLDAEELKELRKKYEASTTEAITAGNAITELKTKFRNEDKEAREKDAQEEKQEQEDKAKEASDRAKKASEDARKRREEENRARIEADKLITDLRLANMQEGVEKEIAINDEKFKRLLEQNSANALITAEQRKAIEDQLNIQKATETKEITDKAAEEKKAADEESLAASIELANREILAKSELNAKDLEGKMALLDVQKSIELQNKDLTESEKALIEEKYRILKVDEEKNAADKEIAIAKEKADAKAKIEQQYRDSVISLTEGIFAITNGFGKQDEKSKEERAKRQFKVQKALNLGLAIIDGYKAITSTLAQSPIAIGPIPNPAGIASLAFAVTTSFANVAKIASSQYKGGGGGGSTPPAVAPPTGGGGGGEVSSPQFNSNALFSTGGGSTQGITSGSQSQNVATPVIKAVVVESDITNTQQRMSNIRQQATI